MKTLREIVSFYKTEKGLFTDEAAANCLGCTKHAFSNYMRGDRRMPDTLIIQLSEITGITPAEIITSMNLNLKTIDEHEKGFWLERATDYAAVIAATAIAACGFSPSQANAATNMQGAQSVYYVNKRKAWAKRMMALILGRFTPMA